MKHACTMIILLSQIQATSGIAQENEGLFYEPSVFSTKFLDYYLRVDSVLPRYSNVFYDPLVETICIPPFMPAWSFQIYHPVYEVVGKPGLKEYHEDTVQFIVQFERADKPIQFGGSKRAPKNKAQVTSRQIPGQSATEIEFAFSAALSSTRWPKSRDLLSIDGTEYHFVVHNRATDVLMWAQSILPEQGTRAKKLVDLSDLVGKFVLAKDDSDAGQILIDIHHLCEELRK